MNQVFGSARGQIDAGLDRILLDKPLCSQLANEGVDFACECAPVPACGVGARAQTSRQPVTDVLHIGHQPTTPFGGAEPRDQRVAGHDQVDEFPCGRGVVEGRRSAVKIRAGDCEIAKTKRAETRAGECGAIIRRKAQGALKIFQRMGIIAGSAEELPHLYMNGWIVRHVDRGTQQLRLGSSGFMLGQQKFDELQTHAASLLQCLGWPGRVQDAVVEPRGLGEVLSLGREAGERQIDVGILGRRFSESGQQIAGGLPS